MRIGSSNSGALEPWRVILLRNEMLVINVRCILGKDALLVDSLRLYIAQSLFIHAIRIVRPVRKRSANPIGLHHRLVNASWVRYPTCIS